MRHWPKTYSASSLVFTVHAVGLGLWIMACGASTGLDVDQARGLDAAVEDSGQPIADAAMADATTDALTADGVVADAIVDTCATGYVHVVDGCAPLLTGLPTSQGSLSPALNEHETAYTIGLGLFVDSVTLTPETIIGATITINGEVVASGTPWQPPPLGFDAVPIEIVVSEAGHPSRSYTITITRGDPSVVPGWSFREGESVIAVSGDTLVIGNPDAYSGAGAVSVFVRDRYSWLLQALLRASNADERDAFGANVAISGDTVLVGAPGEASNARGVNGDATDNSAEASGAAYVFTRAGETWTQQAYLKASNSELGDRFGWSVAVDGDIVAVGAAYEWSAASGVNGDQWDNNALESGAVYVFEQRQGAWAQQAYIKALDPDISEAFGHRLALSGTTLAVGCGDASAASGINGNLTDESAPGSGAVYVYERLADGWSPQAYVKASNPESDDFFGQSVAMSGDTLVVGSPCESSASTGVNGDQLNNDAPFSGAVYVFARRGDVWTQQAYLKASNTDIDDRFGQAVAISGDLIVVGGPREASVATGINGDQSDDSVFWRGAAYAFTRTDSAWSHTTYIKPPSSVASAGMFGAWVGVSGEHVVIGSGETVFIY